MSTAFAQWTHQPWQPCLLSFPGIALHMEDPTAAACEERASSFLGLQFFY